MEGHEVQIPPVSQPDPISSAPDPLSPRAFDEFAAEYDTALNRGLRFTGESKEYFAEGRLNWVRRVLGPAFQPGWRCLDYGCGIGAATPFLARIIEASDITGVDTSAESCDLARQAHGGNGARFSHPDALAAQAGSFDFAYCNGVFHHIPPDARAKAVAQIASALKPGGWFAFWENNPWNPITRLLMRFVPFDHDAILLWPSEARRLVGTTGLRVQRTDFLFIFPSALGFLRPLEFKISGLPFGAQYLVLAQKPAV